MIIVGLESRSSNCLLHIIPFCSFRRSIVKIEEGTIERRDSTEGENEVNEDPIHMVSTPQS